MAATTIRTVRRPRTKVCRARLAKTRRTPGIIATARAPAESSESRAGVARAVAATHGGYMEARDAGDTDEVDGDDGDEGTRRTRHDQEDARQGRTDERAEPSAAPDVTFAPISCRGVCATAGSRAIWSGRVNAPALASIATTIREEPERCVADDDADQPDDGEGPDGIRAAEDRLGRPSRHGQADEWSRDGRREVPRESEHADTDRATKLVCDDEVDDEQRVLPGVARGPRDDQVPDRPFSKGAP